MVSQRINCEKSGKTVVLMAQSARRLQLSPIYKNGEVYENGELVGMDFDGDFSIKVGEVAVIGRQKYKINKVSKIMSTNGAHITGYYLHIAELNKSSMFIMPFLGYKRDYFRWDKEFVNCFVGTEDEGSDYTIYLWYKYTGSVEMEALEAKLKGHSNFEKIIDVDHYHVLYKFSVPERYLDDYMLILEGKYSLISEEAKERILDFHSSSRERPLGKILYKDPERRKLMEKELQTTIPEELDLYDPFYEKDEVFFNSYRIPKTVLS